MDAKVRSGRTVDRMRRGRDGDDLASTDEVKVYKYEDGDENRASENLSEDKLSIVNETEEVCRFCCCCVQSDRLICRSVSAIGTVMNPTLTLLGSAETPHRPTV